MRGVPCAATTHVTAALPLAAMMQAPLAVGYAFMAKKMASMQKVLDDAQNDAEGVVFQPFNFEEHAAQV